MQRAPREDVLGERTLGAEVRGDEAELGAVDVRCRERRRQVPLERRDADKSAVAAQRDDLQVAAREPLPPGLEPARPEERRDAGKRREIVPFGSDRRDRVEDLKFHVALGLYRPETDLA